MHRAKVKTVFFLLNYCKPSIDISVVPELILSIRNIVRNNKMFTMKAWMITGTHHSSVSIIRARTICTVGRCW